MKCPLCLESLPLGPGGICLTCQDERTSSRREALAEAISAADSIELTAQNISKRFHKAHAATLKKKQEEAERKERQAKAKEVSAHEKEEASIALARRSLLHYIERYDPRYDASWAHEDVARKLERFVAAVERNESPRLMIVLPSRFGKSMMASETAPAWILGQHPDWQIITASSTDVLPMAFSRKVREQLRDPEYHKIFPSGARLNPEDSSAKAWTTLQGGGLRATGVGGQILGFGANVIIFDDLVKDFEDADNPKTMEKIYDWMSSVAYSRLLPGGGILLIMQRMSYDDPVGRLEDRMYKELAEVQELRNEAAKILQNPSATEEDLHDAKLIVAEADELDSSLDRWEIATYPALATHDEFLTPEGEIVRLQPTMEAHSAWRPLRKKGEALHPKRYTRSYYLKLKRGNARRFAAMYQLSPQSDEGEYFNRGMFRRYEEGHHPDLRYAYTFAAWDLAIGTKQENDHTVGIAGCYDHNGALWLLDRIRGKWGDIRMISDMIIDLHLKWGCVQTGIERTHVEMAMGPILHTRMRERNEMINLAEGKEALKPVSDKKVRARPLQNLCQAGKVYVPHGDDWDDYINIMTRFGATHVDDDVDATAWLAILAGRYTPPRSPKEEARLQQRQREGERDWYEEFIDEYVLNKRPDGNAFMGS